MAVYPVTFSSPQVSKKRRSLFHFAVRFDPFPGRYRRGSLFFY